jgi:phosphoglycolate phosphatase
MTKAVIFDFDFTLVDSSVAVIDCVNTALEQLGHSTSDEDTIRHTIGMSMPEIYRKLTGDTSTERAAEFRRRFRLRADEVMSEKSVVFPETLPTLFELKSRGIRIGIVSNKYRYRIIEMLKDKSIVPNPIDVIVGSEDVSQPKPHPEGVVTALKRLQANPVNAIFVGDSTIDAMTARNAGIRFVAVLSGVTKKSDLDAYDPIAVIDSLAQLTSALPE